LGSLTEHSKTFELAAFVTFFEFPKWIPIGFQAWQRETKAVEYNARNARLV